MPCEEKFFDSGGWGKAPLLKTLQGQFLQFATFANLSQRVSGPSMPRLRPVSADQLRPLKAMDAELALRLLGAHVGVDRGHVVSRHSASRRLVVTAQARTFRLVVTGPKWFDLAAGCGGHGAIDLGLHLTGRPFLKVVRLLLAALAVEGSALCAGPSRARLQPARGGQTHSASK